jgi:hypothetical protein
MSYKSKRDEADLPAIISVGALDGDTFGITLESGNTILLELKDRIREPAFAALIESGNFYKPRTDGMGIYWPGGVYIALKEILVALLSRDEDRQSKANE